MTEAHELQTREKHELEGEGTRPGPVFRPDVDILERQDAYVIYADLPGVDDRSIDVRLDRGELTLDARQAAPPDAGWRPLHAEYRLGSYHRVFRVSEDIDGEAVTARMNAGVLELTLPKSAARKPRAIPVRPG